MKSLKEGDHSEDPGIVGRIILKWTLKKSVGEAAVASSGEHRNGP
jgi:hypothetical protein